MRFLFFWQECPPNRKVASRKRSSLSVPCTLRKRTGTLRIASKSKISIAPDDTRDYNPENLEKMKKFEKHVREMVVDEANLIQFISDHYDEIEWD